MAHDDEFCNLCGYHLSLHGDPPNCDVAALKAQLIERAGHLIRGYA